MGSAGQVISLDFWNTVLQIVGPLVAAGAVYGGIRSDLRALHEKVESALHSASRAHERLDHHLERIERSTP